MNIVARRTPLSWAMLTFGVIFAALATYAVRSGGAYLPGRAGQASQHILESANPQSYRLYLRMYVCYAVIGFFFAFVRVIPLENGWKTLRARSRSAIHARGYDSKAAPMWAYLVLLLVIGLIVWIGWKTIYAD